MSLNDRFMSYSVINLLKVMQRRTAGKTTHASIHHADNKGALMNTAQSPSSPSPSSTMAPTVEEPPELRDLAIPCQRARAEHTAGNSLPSQVALLVASHTAQSKAALVRETGLPRSTVSACVDTLIRHGLLTPTGTIAVDRGRPAERLAINEKLGLLALADVGARHTMLAVADMNMRLLACERHIIDVSAFSPSEFLDWLAEQLWRLAGKTRPDLPMRHAVLGLPARLDMRDGSPIRPPIMPGWDAFDTVGYLGEALGCPVMVENDTNLRALGDAAIMPASEQPLIEVKIGTGIGGGIIGSDGRIFHGFNGAAGEVGHTCFDPRIRRRCACGQTGCLEAVAAVPAMLRRLQELSPAAEAPTTVEQLIERLRDGNLGAEQTVEEAGEAIGTMIATLCNVLNPRHVIVGGMIVEASDELLTVIRTTVYRKARPLTTRNLTIGRSPLGRFNGLAGALVLATDRALSAEHLLDR